MFTWQITKTNFVFKYKYKQLKYKIILFKVTKICLNFTLIFYKIGAVFNPIYDVTNHLVELIFSSYTFQDPQISFY